MSHVHKASNVSTSKGLTVFNPHQRRVRNPRFIAQITQRLMIHRPIQSQHLPKPRRQNPSTERRGAFHRANGLSWLSNKSCGR